MDFFILLPLKDDWSHNYFNLRVSYHSLIQFYLMTNKIEKRIYNGYYDKASKLNNKYRYHTIESKLSLHLSSIAHEITISKSDDREIFYKHRIVNDAVPVPCNKKINAILTELIEKTKIGLENNTSVCYKKTLFNEVYSMYGITPISKIIFDMFFDYQMNILKTIKKIGYQNYINLIKKNLRSDAPCGCHIYSDEIKILKKACNDFEKKKQRLYISTYEDS